jgi:DNA-binding transcriptional regulator GbsR (MarR family)
MPYNTKSVLSNEKPYKVFRKLIETPKGNYSSKIAEDLDSSQQTVSQIISKFKEIGIVQEGERNKAQYYVIDINGLNNIFWNLAVEETDFDDLKTVLKVHVIYKSIDSGDQKDVDEIESLLNDFEDKNQVADELKTEFGDQYLDFIHRYVIYYLESVESSTIRDMMFSDMLIGISDQISLSDNRKYDLPVWMFTLEEFRKINKGLLKDPSNFVYQSILDIKDIEHGDNVKEDIGRTLKENYGEMAEEIIEYIEDNQS